MPKHVLINSQIKVLPEDSTLIDGQSNFYLNLLSSLGYPEEHLPLGHLLSQMLGLAGEWFVLSPVHWQATHNDAMILSCGEELLSTEQESRQWFNELSDFLKADGFELVYFDPSCWLISRNSKPMPQAKTVYQMRNCSMFPELSKLDDSMFWQQFITENQMYFSAHPLNLQRLKDNKLTVNGLWVWGGGSMVLSDQNLCATKELQALAKLCSKNTIPYSPDGSLKDIDCLLVNELEEVSAPHRQYLSASAASWFYNDYCFKKNKIHWWQRLWRIIKNENQTTNTNC